MAWTDERVALLEKLWTEGKSAAEIAKALSEGVTRNAVIGKAHRMGLSGRPSPVKKKKAEVLPKVKAKIKSKTNTNTNSTSKQQIVPEGEESFVDIAARAAAATSVEASTGDGISIMELTDRVCKWPFGDPRDQEFHFCGSPSQVGKPYCPDHASMAYQTSSRKGAAKKPPVKKSETSTAS